MDFYEVVRQVIDLLQQQDRVTYRGLKLQFKLDDDTLEALKEEVLYTKIEILIHCCSNNIQCACTPITEQRDIS